MKDTKSLNRDGEKKVKIEEDVFRRFYGKICCNGDYCKDGHEEAVMGEIKELLHTYRDLLIHEIYKLPAHSSDFTDGDVLEKSDVLSIITNL